MSNGSFEVGIDQRIAIGAWYTSGLSALSLSGDAAHGEVSLRVPFLRLAYSAAAVNGVQVRGTEPLAVANETDYELSVWLRADGPVVARIALLGKPPDGRRPSGGLAERQVSIDRQWRRFRLAYRATTDHDVYWSVSADSKVAGHVFVDAVSFGLPGLSSFTPRAPLELALRSDRPGHIHDAGIPVPLRLSVADYRSAGQSRGTDSIRIDVFDLAGVAVHREAVDVDLRPGRFELPVGLPALPHGSYRVVATFASHRDAQATLQFHVLPKPRSVSKEHGMFGVYATLAPEPLGILRRAGFSWLGLLTTAGRTIYWDQVEPEPGQFRWYDADLAMATDMGFGVMMNLEPCKLPRWALGFDVAARRAAWADYVRAIVGHYGNRVRYWTIADEVQGGLKPDSWKHRCWSSAEQYVPWHRAGAAAVREVQPDARIVLNTNDRLAERLLSRLGDQVDVFADNAWHLPTQLNRSFAAARRAGIRELWAPGIAVPARPWYPAHTAEPLAANYWEDRSRELAAAVVRSIGAGAAKLFQYTATHVGNTDVYSLFESDSSLKPIGAQFAALAWHLDGVESARRVPVGLGVAGAEAWRIDRTDGVTVFPLVGLQEKSLLRLPGIDSEAIEVFDRMGNRLPALNSDAGIEVSVRRPPLFLRARGIEPAIVETALATLTQRLGTLPSAAQVQREGAFAVLEDIADGLYRRAPNISLWYESAELGWREILRYRASTYTPRYRATPDGFVIDWSFRRERDAFFLEPGQIPMSLLDGALIRAAWPRDGGIDWRRLRLDPARGEFTQSPQSPVSSEDVADPSLTLVIDTTDGLRIRFDTTLTGPVGGLKGQAGPPGGWKLLHRGPDDAFLHRYFGPDAAADIQMQVVVSVRQQDALR